MKGNLSNLVSSCLFLRHMARNLPFDFGLIKGNQWILNKMATPTKKPRTVETVVIADSPESPREEARQEGNHVDTVREEPPGLVEPVPVPDHEPAPRPAMEQAVPNADNLPFMVAETPHRHTAERDIARRALFSLTPPVLALVTQETAEIILPSCNDEDRDNNPAALPRLPTDIRTVEETLTFLRALMQGGSLCLDLNAGGEDMGLPYIYGYYFADIPAHFYRFREETNVYIRIRHPTPYVGGDVVLAYPDTAPELDYLWRFPRRQL